MNDKRTTIEKIAPSIDEAVDSGLAELGLLREDVEIEILDEGSRGLFGLGSRQARVRLTVKSLASTTAAPQDRPAPAKVEAEKPLRPSSVSMPAQAPVMEASSTPQPPKISATPLSLEDELTLNAAKETIEELLGFMQIPAEVAVYYGEADERQSRAPVMIDLSGEDLSILIGKHAETLSALQYITGLIVSKKVGHMVTVIIDVENYRRRRANQIRQLANRVADQVAKTGRRQSLEPMPANERRIVHVELRNNPQVRTESTGIEPHRKVVIHPAD